MEAGISECIRTLGGSRGRGAAGLVLVSGDIDLSPGLAGKAKSPPAAPRCIGELASPDLDRVRGELTEADPKSSATAEACLEIGALACPSLASRRESAGGLLLAIKKSWTRTRVDYCKFIPSRRFILSEPLKA